MRRNTDGAVTSLISSKGLTSTASGGCFLWRSVLDKADSVSSDFPLCAVLLGCFLWRSFESGLETAVRVSSDFPLGVLLPDCFLWRSFMLGFESALEDWVSSDFPLGTLRLRLPYGSSSIVFNHARSSIFSSGSPFSRRFFLPFTIFFSSFLR